VCTVHRTEPFGTQVFDFTNAGLAGGNEFFADKSLVSIQISFDGDTIHTEVQPRGEPDEREVLQDELVLDEPWQAIRAGFGATALRKGAKLGIEPVVAWSFPVAYVVTFQATDLLAAPDDTAADLGNVPSGTELDVLSKSADGRFLEVEFEGTRGWIANTAGIASARVAGRRPDNRAGEEVFAWRQAFELETPCSIGLAEPHELRMAAVRQLVLLDDEPLEPGDRVRCRRRQDHLGALRGDERSTRGVDLHDSGNRPRAFP
jgi:hypothetical protein